MSIGDFISALACAAGIVLVTTFLSFLIRVFLENIDRIKAATAMLRRRKTVIAVTDAKGTIGIMANKCSAKHFYAVLMMFVQHGVITKKNLDDMYEDALKEGKNETPRS